MISSHSSRRYSYIALVLAACSSPSSGVPIGRDIVIGLVDTVYLPAMAELGERMPALVTASEALCGAPDASRLDAARAAWRSVRVPWKHLEAMAIGPVMTERIDAELDFWPARVADIEDELALATPIDDVYVATLGATRKGLPVIEYLLFGEPSHLSDPRACTYLVALARRAADRANALATAWRPDAADYRAQLVDAGPGSMYGSIGEAIDTMGNALIIAIENAEGLKLARPLGRRDGGTPQPEAVESRFSDNARTDLLDSLAGARAVYTSTYGDRQSEHSFSSFIRSRDRALDAEVLAQLVACEDIVAGWPAPLAELVVTAPDAPTAAFDCTKQLLALLKADVAALIGVTPTFGDVDGD